MFLRLKVSLAAVKTDILSTPAAMARSSPFSFGTSAEYTTPSFREIVPKTSPASESCGTALVETKALTSISPTPVQDSWRRQVRGSVTFAEGL
jgi:hypothetical protein